MYTFIYKLLRKYNNSDIDNNTDIIDTPPQVLIIIHNVIDLI